MYADRQEAIKLAYEQNISISEAIKSLKETSTCNGNPPQSSYEDCSEVVELKREMKEIKKTLSQLQSDTREDIKIISEKVPATEEDIH